MRRGTFMAAQRCTTGAEELRGHEPCDDGGPFEKKP